jgi:integrase
MNTPDSPHYVAPGKPRLLDQVRWVIRLKHYSSKTETAYIGWIRRFIFFHGKRHPAQMGAEQVAQFLSHLALERQVAASTQNQAFNALIFLYHRVLHIDLGEIAGAVRAKKPKRLPVVLNREEVDSILTRLHGEVWLICSLLYGAGLRLFEALQLRVKDTECVWQ